MYTEEQMKTMWDAEMLKRKDASPAFKALMAWLFDFEEYKKVMRLAHLPNPLIKLIE